MQTRLLLVFLPIFIVTFALVSLFTYNISKEELDKEIKDRMMLLEANTRSGIENNFDTHQQVAESIVSIIEDSGRTLDRNDFRNLFSQMIVVNEDTLGAGVWYEPYTHNENDQYFGPYVYKDGDSLTYTTEYETSEYDYPTQDWYRKGVEAGQGEAGWTDPYYDETSGITMVTTAMPFYSDNGDLLGVVSSDIDITSIQKMIQDIQIENTGWAFLIDQEGNYLVPPDGQTMQANIADDDNFSGKIADNILTNMHDMQHMTHSGESYHLHYTTIPRTGWKLGLMMPEKELYAPLQELLLRLSVTGFVVLIGMVALIYFVSNRLTLPIKKLAGEVNKVANGDLTVSVSSEYRDEIGQLTNDFNHMVTNMNGLINEVNHSIRHVRESSENLSAISEETNATSEEVHSAISEITNGASVAASDAENVNQRTIDLSDHINKVKLSTEDMMRLSQEAEKSNDQGLSQIESLLKRSRESDNVIESIEDVIKGLADKVREIEKVISTINDISEQTNLLALNAGIEAARAGAEGKGFAVVAEEVRKLAEQSSQATEKVRVTLEGIGEESNKAVSHMDKTKKIAKDQSHSVQDTEEAFKTIAATIDKLVDSISSVTNDVTQMNESKDQVVESIQNISASTEQSAASCEEVSASYDEQLHAITSIAESAEQLNASSQDLDKMIKKFKVQKS